MHYSATPLLVPVCVLESFTALLTAVFGRASRGVCISHPQECSGQLSYTRPASRHTQAHPFWTPQQHRPS